MRIALLLAPVLVAAFWAPNARAQASNERVSDADKPAVAATIIDAMTGAMASVDGLVEEARGERDAVRLNCVSERKSEIAGLLKVAERSLAAMNTALDNGQGEAAEHEFSKVIIAGDKVDGYATEAQQCIGMLAFYDGEDVERDFSDANKDTPHFDPTRPSTPPAPTFRAPPASPVE